METVHGCTNPSACSFDSLANVDNGLCDYSTCYAFGCTDASANNYDSNASINDGSCQYEVVPVGVGGCTDAGAINYDINNASMNNGTCIYNVHGCTNDMACNYDYRATVDNGSCEFETCYGCMSKRACNYNAYATHPSSCEFVLPLEIDGEFSPRLGVEKSYSYPMTAGSEYVWNVVGGQILSALHNEVVVVWTSTEGVLTVRELNSYSGCEGIEVVKPLVRAEQLEDLSFTVFPNPYVM